ncbi:MAG: sigma-54-dependent Fis family transcriptional regulator [Spirochaetales bacterium]|nr:sigma-54-dependent Fis family transcriptional regulator [Spirochaetales bacterium]
MKRTILVVDDEKYIREGLVAALEMDGYTGLQAENGQVAWKIINSEPVDMVITDLRMPDMSGSELLKKIYTTYPTIPVVVLTGHGTIEDAVTAMQNGAVDFLTKPVNLDHLSVLIKRSLASKDMAEKNRELRTELENLKKKSGYTSIIGKSQKILKLIETIQQIAPSKASVLITGESGVGKELVADAIVNYSDRRDKPFVKVHCAALNSNLLESELFGHVKGAFTGAVADKKGRFELADGGTIFLDEIGEIDASTQIKLLRVLQEREFEKVGGEKTIKTDVRVIAATNRNLVEEIAKGKFREDLYYRLNVVSLEVPPLRERKEDIFLLATSFLNEFCKENKKNIEGFSNEARTAIASYDWPGNIRELRNCVESAVVMCRTSQIELNDLPPAVSKARSGNSIEIELGTTMDEAEKKIILGTVAYCKGNKSKAADVLGLGRKTIIRKMQEYEQSADARPEAE